jgi:hypothetical protein
VHEDLCFVTWEHQANDGPREEAVNLSESTEWLLCAEY